MVKYSMLDRTPIVVTLLVIYFASLIPQMVFARRGRPATHLELRRGANQWGGSVLIVMAIILFADGAFDKTPPLEAIATVIDKRTSHSSRGGTSYYLTVAPSWRPGRLSEELLVNGQTFSIVSSGGNVSIAVHAGFFHLPWYNDIEPR
jgi:hypothetical protein